jgi:polysaccharide export outer membrane protein
MNRTGITRKLHQQMAGLCLLALGLIVAGCQSPSTPTNSSLNPLDASIPSMPGTLREGDVIQIAFATSTNLNSTQRIQLDGQISLQFVNNVMAAGETPAELAQALEKLYQPHLRGAEPITVTLVTSAAAIYVTGAVLRPGKIPLDRPLTVVEAINEAGGPDHTRARLSGVTVLRIENGKRVARRVNIKKALDGSDNSLFYVKPSDTVYVPEKVINF